MIDAEALARPPTASVVIATYQRPDKARRLLDQLDRQTVPPYAFEVIVVDDGSSVPFTDDRDHRYRSVILRQANGGPGAARRTGIAHASGEVIVVVDDDMILRPDFLAAHLAAHERGCDVVIGRFTIAQEELPLYLVPTMTVFEEYFLRCEASDDAVQPGRLATGNVSFGRALYERVGGFDAGLRQAEDRELGVRFALAGARFGFAHGADTEHDNDRTRIWDWPRFGWRFGRTDVEISRRHPSYPGTDPFERIGALPLPARLVVVSLAIVPAVGRGAATVQIAAGLVAEKLRQTTLALVLYKLSLATAHASGVSSALGGPAAMLDEVRSRRLVSRTPRDRSSR